MDFRRCGPAIRQGPDHKGLVRARAAGEKKISGHAMGSASRHQAAALHSVLGSDKKAEMHYNVVAEKLTVLFCSKALMERFEYALEHYR